MGPVTGGTGGGVGGFGGARALPRALLPALWQPRCRGRLRCGQRGWPARFFRSSRVAIKMGTVTRSLGRPAAAFTAMSVGRSDTVRIPPIVTRREWHAVRRLPVDGRHARWSAGDVTRHKGRQGGCVVPAARTRPASEPLGAMPLAPADGGGSPARMTMTHACSPPLEPRHGLVSPDRCARTMAESASQDPYQLNRSWRPGSSGI